MNTIKYVVFDSNMLFQSGDSSLGSFSLNRKIRELCESLATEHCEIPVKFLIPEIVKKEIIKQKQDEFNAAKRKLGQDAEALGKYVTVSFNHEIAGFIDQIDKAIEDEMNSLDMSIVPCCSSECFHELVDRAIEKRPPFEGKGKTSDKGFKDTLIFLSLREYAVHNPGDYYYVTKDKAFIGDNSQRLSGEFRRNTQQLLVFCDDLDFLKNELYDSAIVTDDTVESVELEYENTEKQIGNNQYEVPLDISISIPKIVSPNNHSIERINQDIRRYYDNVEAAWKAWELDPGPYWPEMRYEGRIRTDVVYNQKGLLSLIIKAYGYCGGAHGGRHHRGLVYNLNSGRRLSLVELLPMDEAGILQRVKDCVKKDRENHIYRYWDDFEPGYSNSDEINFFLSQEGIVLIFNQYEAGCYASGIHYLKIADLEELVAL